MPSGADRRLFLAAAAVVVVADLATKLVVEQTLALRNAVSVIGETFQLRLVYNPGAAFGLHLGPYSRWIFLAVAIGAIVILDRMSRTALPGDRLRQFACGLVAGGAFGNLVDRIRSTQGVVDFLDVGIGIHRWPTFNVADIGVSCGAILLAWSLWQEDNAREQGRTGVGTTGVGTTGVGTTGVGTTGVGTTGVGTTGVGTTGVGTTGVGTTGVGTTGVGATGVPPVDGSGAPPV